MREGRGERRGAGANGGSTAVAAGRPAHLQGLLHVRLQLQHERHEDVLLVLQGQRRQTV